MDIKRLEAFAKVYELRSFSKAGQELFLSQPTISAHVSTLESELGCPLFDRLGRSVLPTQAAKILYRYTQKTFEQLECARAEIGLLRERVAGELVVGGSTIPAHYMLPGIVAGFQNAHPEVTTHLKVADSEAVVDMVLDGRLAIGLVGSEIDREELHFEEILSEEMVCIASSAMQPAPADSIDPTEASTLPWVLREPGSGTRRAFERSIAGIGLDIRSLKTAATVESTAGVLQCVRAGVGVSVTSRLAAGECLRSGELREFRILGLDMPRSFHLTYHKRRHLFPIAHRFIDYLKEHLHDLHKAVSNQPLA